MRILDPTATGSMRSALIWVFVLACAFPYTRLLPINSITQPYAMLLAVWLTIVYCHDIPRAALRQAAPLGVCLLISCVMYVGALGNGVDFGSLKWLSGYVSAFFTFLISLYFIAVDSRTVKYALVVSLLGWLVVGIVQRSYDPTFLTSLTSERHREASAVLLESGRGVLGLAHEPTHHAFHIILLAATCLQLGVQPQILITGAAALAVLLLAMSSSALLCLGLGLGIFVIRAHFLKALSVLFAGLVVFGLILQALPDESRVVDLLLALVSNPLSLLSVDYSLNMRLGGLIAAGISIGESLFVPHGISHLVWMNSISQYYSRFPWLFEISEEGWPSGYLLVIYQLGLLSLPFIVFLRNAIAGVDQNRIVSAWFAYTAITVFLFQFYITSPMFGIFFASIYAMWAPWKQEHLSVKAAFDGSGIAAVRR